MAFLIPFLIVTALILLNGMFVAAEFAIIGAPRATIERRAAEGHAAARRVSRILSDPRRQDRYIATAQLGITFASLGLGMYGEHTLAEWLAVQLEGFGLHETTGLISAHALASIIAIAFFTYFHIVVGEMVPKSMALMHAEATAYAVTRPMLAIKAVMYPLVVALNATGNGLLRLVGIRRELGASQYYTSEELQYIVRESQEGGLLRAESGQMLRELFEFGALTAGEAMVPRVRVTGIPLGAGTGELRRRLLEARHTRYPVYEGDLDHIAGVVHIKDVLRLLQSGRPLTREDVRPTAYIPEGMELDRVLASMHQARTQLIVVMDEHGGTAGILTIEDLVAEVVGEVDEGADDLPDLMRDAAGRLSVHGTLRLADVGEHFGLTLEHDEVDTVSGLILTLLERPARVGDAVTYEGLRFEVTHIAGHGVERCLIERLPTLDTPAAER